MFYVLTLGDAVMVTESNPYSLPLALWSIHEVDGTIPDLNTHAWDFQSDGFVKFGGNLSRVDFILRFTASEWEAAATSSDINIKQGMALILAAEYIDVADMRTMMLVGYCAMIGLILDSRVAEILA
ncbi:hypothetical protein [Malikia spinosa]|uniref:hypothetical protein n=1 Tax=Malikia spinosa TaxID=86180 RepID=UPI002FD8DBEC